MQKKCFEILEDAVIRKAARPDIDLVEKSCIELLLHEKEHGAYTIWQLGVYPTRATAEDGVREGSMYVMEQDGGISASIILDRTQPKEYESIDWNYPAQSDEVLVVHLLCVRPSKAGQGIGRAMVQFAIEEGKRLNCKAVRLDAGAQNKPAVALYQKLGFEIAATSSMAVGGLIAHERHLFFEKKIRTVV